MGTSRTFVRASLAAGALAFAASSLTVGCQEPLPPYPSATIAIDTDLPVPRVVEHLRVDVFDDDGTWIDTRDYPRTSAADFPASFSIFTKDESRPREVTLRIRAYPEGGVRDYRGHRGRPAVPFVPPALPESIDELCAGATELPIGSPVTLRRGNRPVSTPIACETVTRTGGAAAKIVVTKQGRYRFEVVGHAPSEAFGGIDTMLTLRKDCRTPRSEVACNDDIASDDFLSRIVTDLEPGSYTLIVGGTLRNQPADVTLQWDEESRFSAARVPPPLEYVVPATDGPRLVVDGRDLTPTLEPAPTASVDRLVRVRLEPGVSARARFGLYAACATVEPKLVFDADFKLRVDQSLSCATDGSLAPVTAAVAKEAFDAPSIGAAATEEPCDPGSSDDHVVCVPGGAFVLGERAVDSLSDALPIAAYPLRVARVSRFWMDRREVTVGRYRQARAEGLAIDEYTDAVELVANGRATLSESEGGAATWSKRDLGREAFPLDYVAWAHAREVCAFYGGELPTEAQWEYAATTAGRPVRTLFPWGETPPTCARVVAARTTNAQLGTCGNGVGPVSVDELLARGDVTPLGIEGLGGNVAEHVLDSAARYDAPCWTGGPAKDAFCNDPTDPYRIARGGSWRWPPGYARATLRQADVPGFPLPTTGFRCVYREKPTRDWVGP